MRRSVLALSAAALLSLAACGDSMLDRSMSGAGIGATVGVVGGAVAGGALLPGLMIGGAVGAATGVITDASQINLGRPIWEK